MECQLLKQAKARVF